MTRKCYQEDYYFCVSLCYNTEILLEGGVVQGQGEGQQLVGNISYRYGRVDFKIYEKKQV